MPVQILLIIFILIVPLVPTFWAIMDIPRRRFSTTKAKMIWFAVVSVLPFVGAMIYIFLGRRRTQPIE